MKSQYFSHCTTILQSQYIFGLSLSTDTLPPTTIQRRFFAGSYKLMDISKTFASSATAS